MRSILITGCSSGIGLHAARHLKAEGWRVFATCRREEDVARLQAEGLESLRLDYEDPASIEAAWTDIMIRTGGTLDALFNNGAYAIPALIEDLPVNALRQNFEANLFGWHDLSQRAIKVMRKQGHGRIVQCSSVLGFITTKFRGSYSATKHALEALTTAMRLELKDSGIGVSLIEPGPIATDFRLNSRKQFDKWIDWEKSDQSQRYSKLVSRLYATDKAPDAFELQCDAVTEKLMRALESPRPKARYHVTKVTTFSSLALRFLPPRATEWMMSKG
ncbi:SDR family NAD(P)-dependent oxidoreductase [Celeribacter litoreus]|uniref:SDR family NAD(P)-dependent oxidoreductase n=1 Tax=Celeribacter litoreus TaxID=2876714 RepID=UPI001CCB61BC|nr:SDR family NAD(P)-dependent oxidoreductase [Celeribacter litoreus]MCA0042388.1 SDR family NAD(P)-dependent oxidoreductase [Celeribacter litoreus]